MEGINAHPRLRPVRLLGAAPVFCRLRWRSWISWGSTFYLFGLLVQLLEAALQISCAQSSLGFSLMLLGDRHCSAAGGR